MAENILIRPGFFHWSIFENGRRVGQIKIPFFKQHFLRYGNALVDLEGERFELTYPKRMAGLLGHKESSVKLMREVVVWLEVSLEIADGNTILRFTWKGDEFLVAQAERGWRVFAEGSPLFLIELSGLFNTQFTVRGLDARVPLEMVVAIVWAIQCPLQIVH